MYNLFTILKALPVEWKGINNGHIWFIDNDRRACIIPLWYAHNGGRPG